MNTPTSFAAFAVNAFRAAGKPIVFDGTASPVKTTLFAIICIAWLLPGLIGHDPWKPDEALSFGAIYAMLQDGQWLIPHIVGSVHHEYPPLYYWSAALCAKLFGWLLPLHDAARLASGFWMALALFYLHKASTRLLDQRSGRICVVLLVGSLGMILRAHELNPEVAGVAGVAMGLYGMTRIRTEARRAGTSMGIGMAVVALSIGWVPALAIPAAAIVMAMLLRDTTNATLRSGLRLTLLVGTLPSLVYAGLALFNLPAESRTEFLWRAVIAITWLSPVDRALMDPTYLLRILPWYALPTLPFALWLWRMDRAKLRERIELALPLAGFVTLLFFAALFREARDAHGMVLLLPLALAAASVLDRLPQGLARFIDWLSLVFCGLIMTAIWLYWTAAVTGTPAAAARAVARQVPGFDVSFNLFGCITGAVVCAVWFYAVAAAHRNNRRALVNWSAGITLIWVLVNALMLPAIDHVRSYRGAVAEIRAAIPKDACVRGFQLGDAQRALLNYFGNIRVTEPPASAQNESCQWIIAQGNTVEPFVLAPGASVVWEGSRPGDSFERLRVIRVSIEDPTR